MSASFLIRDAADNSIVRRQLTESDAGSIAANHNDRVSVMGGSAWTAERDLEATADAAPLHPIKPFVLSADHVDGDSDPFASIAAGRVDSRENMQSQGFTRQQVREYGH